jgi:hypothetical protein
VLTNFTAPFGATNPPQARAAGAPMNVAAVAVTKTARHRRMCPPPLEY